MPLDPLQDAREVLHAWGAGSLADDLAIEFSPRMSRSLGKYYPQRRLIRLRADLAEPANSVLYHEVLVHELAHLVAASEPDAGDRAHGPVWAALVEAAGYTPSPVAPSASSPDRDERESAVQEEAVWYAHRCPVCGMEKLARAPVHRWKCAECRAAGLAGDLRIVSIAPGVE